VTSITGVTIVALLIGLPVAAFTLWPLLRWNAGPTTFLPVPPDAREQLVERKRQLLRTLRELTFEHEAGHVSDDDYADLRARYEAEAAQVLTELDRLGGARPQPGPAPDRAEAPARAGWRHPLALAACATALVAFGILLGAGIMRHTGPDPAAGIAMPGSRPLAGVLEAPAVTPGESAPRAISPEMLRGMLQAARSSLFAGRYGEAIAAYQAVLKRDPKNVDAITHLGLVVAIGGHADTALETFERALAIDPAYPPALLYRGQVLYEAKRDADGAIRSWEKFLKVAPAGEDHERVKRLIAEARAQK
jgi:cytochrome c-type biogenesis protein CcmH/NrfG